jgi:N-methylhydantoinase B
MTQRNDTQTKSAGADVITTELVRTSLGSAAGQMRQVLMRTAFSQLIYEVLDFACGIFDRKMRLLAQAPSLALFVGTLDACIREAVAAIGGEEQLKPGDILIYNIPYGTGSHPQDSALVMPAFQDGVLVGYSACKAHWVDIGGKDVYSTDTVDVYQEGTVFPGVRLYNAGERNDDVWRMVLANSRAPELLAGDISAQVGAMRTGVQALSAIVEKYGLEDFEASVERIFDHGEANVRAFVDGLPDGRYTAECSIDSDGLTDEEIVYEIAVEVQGDKLVVDLTGVPDQTPGSTNSPLPGTVSAARTALLGLASDTEIPDEGQFRALEVKTRPGSIYEPIMPAPAFSFFIPQIKLIDGILRALAPVVPGLPADSGGDILVVIWWGAQRASYQRRREDEETWIDGSPAPVGQGASALGDGSNALMHVAESCTRITPAEVLEAKNPWLVTRQDLRPDSGGAGEFRGGLGVVIEIEALEDSYTTSVLEATKRAPAGVAGGGEALPNKGLLIRADGTAHPMNKHTADRIEKGAKLRLESGGGGGYGDPAKRPVEAVADDLTDGYITREYAERWFGPQLKEIDG